MTSCVFLFLFFVQLSCRNRSKHPQTLLSPGQSVAAMEMLSQCALSYCRSGKCERAACRSILTLCKWLLADWKDLTPQLKQVVKRNSSSGGPPSALCKNVATLLELPVEEQGILRITTETTGTCCFHITREHVLDFCSRYIVT